MRPKKRYLLVYHNNNGNALDIIKERYAEKFGTADVEKASLKVISDENEFLTLQCNLDCCRHLLETLASLDGKFVALNMSGTLKALRSRQDEIKKSFIARNRY